MYRTSSERIIKKGSEKMHAIRTGWTAQLRGYKRKWLYENKLAEAVIGWSEF